MSDRVLSSHQHAFMRILERGALPLMVAPMFLVSGPELVCACARNGLVGSFPAANARDLGVLRQWMQSISETVSRLGPEAFWSVNMIVHSSYDRFQGELDLVQTFKPGSFPPRWAVRVVSLTRYMPTVAWSQPMSQRRCWPVRLRMRVPTYLFS